MSIQIERTGRRHYLIGAAYQHRDALRAAGCHWDAARRAWWTGDTATATTLAATLTPPTAQDTPQAPGPRATVAGRVKYQGRTYYLAGRVVRHGLSIRDDSVTGVSSRDGTRLLLFFRDGSRQFWAPCAEVQIVAHYERAKTIGGLAKFAAEARDGFPGRATCPNCGSPSCSGTRGDRCEED